MRRVRSTWWLLALPAALSMSAGATAARTPSKPGAKAAAKIVASEKAAGRALFQSTCGVCHTLRTAGTSGTVGPDLDTVKLSEATIVRAIANGGATVMSRARAARYATTMTAYRKVLTAAQIEDVALFVYSSTH